ncbi:GH25 family lysozyme [Cryptosporangium sp. NPDC051539]|uniref:GH25 family lysozyme n=1 Tax=Cryptosporangium sp. NPDC051539 TaxID=3363962 RepID=UPI003787575E
MTFYIIDVSRYNGSIDYELVDKAGIKGVVCKATEGVPSQTSALTRKHFSATAERIRGFPIRGGYHWLHRGNYEAQARHFRDTLVAGFGSLHGLTLQLDAEGSGVTVADVRGFLAAWNRLTGGYPLLGYFPRWYWTGLGADPLVLLRGFAGWWQSAYVSGTGDYLALASKIGNGWDKWGHDPLILQYSSKAHIPGGTAVCDVNQIKMSVPDFLAVTTKNQPKINEQEDETMAKLVKSVADGPAIWLVYDRTIEHIPTMEEVKNLELVYGKTVTVPSLAGLGRRVEEPSV